MIIVGIQKGQSKSDSLFNLEPLYAYLLFNFEAAEVGYSVIGILAGLKIPINTTKIPSS